MRTILTLLTLAILPSPARAQEASAELYGAFRYAYGYADAGDSTHWASANNASRLGVRGQLTRGDWAAFADVQTGLNVDAEAGGGAFTQRYFFAGARSRFGTLVVGRQSTAYKMAGLRLDPFYDTSTLGVGGSVPFRGLYAGASFGLSNLTNGFADRTIAYTSPAFHGVTVNAATFLDPDGEHDYGLGLGVARDGIDAGVQYYDVRGGRTWAQTGMIDQAARLHAAYAAAGAWSVGVSFERLGLLGEEEQNLLYAAGTVNVVPQIALAGAFGYVAEVAGAAATSGTGFHFGVFYALFPQARVHLLYSLVEPNAGPSRSVAALGFTYDFSIKP